MRWPRKLTLMDEIIGIAVLTRTKPQELIVVCRKANGQAFLQRIPVYGVGEGKPSEQAWQYQIAGDTLHCTPSVHCRYQLPPDGAWITRFHNSYNWSVRFQWADAAEPAAVWEEAIAANRDIKFSHGL